jgi:hypothetical protein
MANPRKPLGHGRKEHVVRPPPANPPATPDESRAPTHEEIELRAYYIWEAGGFHDTDPFSDWLRAEEQLWEEFANGGLARANPRTGEAARDE